MKAKKLKLFIVSIILGMVSYFVISTIFTYHGIEINIFSK